MPRHTEYTILDLKIQQIQYTIADCGVRLGSTVLSKQKIVLTRIVISVK